MDGKLPMIIAAIVFLTSAVFGQISSFTFQGELDDNPVAADGPSRFQNKLSDADGNQIGDAVTDVPAPATNGIFAATLDFGAASFDAAARTLEIGMRARGNGQSHTISNPRRPTALTPYTVRGLNANTSTNAADSPNPGGVPAARHVVSADERMSDDSKNGFAVSRVKRGSMRINASERHDDENGFYAIDRDEEWRKK